MHKPMFELQPVNRKITLCPFHAREIYVPEWENKSACVKRAEDDFPANESQLKNRFERISRFSKDS